LTHHPSVKLEPAQKTHSYDPAPPIRVTRIAANNTPTDLVGERERRDLSAAIGLSVPCAELLAFGGVDSEQANALAVNLNRIAVDDRRHTGQRITPSG